MKTKILENLTKTGGVKPSFLKKFNITAKECYIIIYGEHKCKYCDSVSQFISFNKGFKITCDNKLCVNKKRLETYENTCLAKYGVKNIFQSKEHCYENGKQKAHSDKARNKRNNTLMEKYGTTDSLAINNGREIGIFKCNNDETVAQNRKKTCFEKYGGETPFHSQDFQDSLKDIIEEKYGVRNISYLQETKDKISTINTLICTSEEMIYRRNKIGSDGKTSIEKQKNTNIEKGYWISDENKSEFEIYTRNVWKFTNKQPLYLLKNIEKRGHIKYKENAYHLDHRYSIYQGFKDAIPEQIIGNINNLELLIARDNISKNKKCSISKEELLGEYYGKE